MTFARWTFRIAGIYGILVLAPHYFLEHSIGEHHPPAITHPEFFYGFVGLGLVFQFLFLLVATDPVRYRTVMLAGIAEKLSFAIPVAALFATSRVSSDMVLAGSIDVLFGILFAISYVKTPRSAWTSLQARPCGV